MKKIIITSLIFIGFFCMFFIVTSPYFLAYTFYIGKPLPQNIFSVQSIDTMKYSRDLAQQKLYDLSFDSVIDAQMKLIAFSGATHVAIDTPYDKKFDPFLARWVASARAHHLSVWFRGNFSGWEGWFGYAKISRAEHEKMLVDFIYTHPNLFMNGDIFTPCPECENGGPGDPRQTGDSDGYNKFLVDEYDAANDAFHLIGKSVTVYSSMNADIVRYVLTPETARELGGTILIDHYVRSASQFSDDIVSISKKLNVNVGIGEFGAPVEDLNGYMTEAQQSAYVRSLLEVLYDKSNIVPVVNYWVLSGGSTALMRDNGMPREVFETLTSYFKAPKITGTITDPLGEKVSGVKVSVVPTTYSTLSEDGGQYEVFIPGDYRQISMSKEGFKTVVIDFPKTLASSTTIKNVTLEPVEMPLWYRIKTLIYQIQMEIYASPQLH